MVKKPIFKTGYAENALFPILLSFLILYMHDLPVVLLNFGCLD